MKKILILGLLSLNSFALPISDLFQEGNKTKGIKIVSVEPYSTQNVEKKNPLLYFPNPVKVFGEYKLSSLLSILGNAGINVVIEDKIDNPTLLMNLETSSIQEFLNIVCKQANIWCSYDPVLRVVKIRKYKTFTVEFTPEGKITFSLGGGGGGGNGGGGGGNGGNEGGNGGNGGGGGGGGQSFSYTISNLSAEDFINLVKEYFPTAKIWASQQGYIMFSADPRTYREIVKYFKEKEKREERIYVDVELVRIDLKKEYQWGLNWSGIADIGRIQGLRHLQYSFQFLPLTTGDMGKFALLTSSGGERALFTLLSQYGKVYKVDSYYAQTRTGTPLPFRNYKLVRYFTVSVETDQNGNAIPNAELQQDEVGFRGVITVYKREKGEYKYYVDGAVDLSAIADWITVNIAGNQLTAPEIVGQTFKISTPLRNLYSTIIVGGFRSKGINKNTNGMPGLMNSPAIGWLFKGKKDMSQTSEFLVVIHLRPAVEETSPETWLEQAGEEIFKNE